MIYFDNAATTPMFPEVIETISKLMIQVWGNPSSVHHYGRTARVQIERARRFVAEAMNVSPSEIFFNSGGTEGNNMVLRLAVQNLGIKRIVTSPLEHPSVLRTAEWLAAHTDCELSLLAVDGLGHFENTQLEQILADKKPTLVSLMHANNEISNLLSIKDVSTLCHKYNALFHSDMVQTVGHYQIDLQAIDVDFIASSAHKFHGPKGVGFLYINPERVRMESWFTGGGQERNMRPGTENITGIVGLAKALELSLTDIDAKIAHVKGLKKLMIQELQSFLPSVSFIGDSEERGLYTVLSVVFPANKYDEMLVANLDIEGIAASMGSACASGTSVGSHVIEALAYAPDTYPIRFSFSHMNTPDEVRTCTAVLRKLLV
ncbi:MAG: hypothetical protein RIS47_721 [Bacteroidota bacterium]|jgi:cysteine desulfurase